MSLEDAVRNRKIQSLYHFTKLQSVSSIMENGILSCKRMDTSGIVYEPNDLLRLDYEEGHISVTIDHPNYKMFWGLRSDNPNQEWVVIGIKREILWEKDCIFCHENAASNNVTLIPVEQRKGVAAFEKMFEPYPGIPTRKDLQLTDNLPTNPQAEVLIPDIIEPKYILSLLCGTIKVREQLKAQYDGIVHVVRHMPAFSPRLDYKAWKKNG